MEKFYLKSKTKSLLAINTNFYLADSRQLEELKGLYYFLYNAQDFETLRQNICWARTNVNPQMFIFALTQTLMKREDFKDLNLPKIYEIWPQHFFNKKYIRKLQNFDYSQWSKEETLYECYNKINKTDTIYCKTWQWWCKQHLNFKIYEENQMMILPKTIDGNFRNSSKWNEALEDVSLYWLPVDFSRDTQNYREYKERRNSYLLEDKDWNSYWYYINMGIWFNSEQSDMYTNDIRNWWFWNLQQLVIRYKMESNSIKLKTYLSPHLIDFQGKNYHIVDDQQSTNVLKFLKDLTFKTQIALNEQTYQLKQKTRLHLNNPEDFELFLNENFNVQKILKILMSKQSHDTVLQNFETMLRSNEFYIYAELLVDLYRSLKSNFEPYKQQDLDSNDLVINNVDITELNTYFEITDTDVTNLLRSSNIYFEGKLLWFKALLARQANLQHQPFDLLFNVTSEKPQAVIVRTFMARKCAPQESMCFQDSSYFQLDTFVSNLAAGYNIIERQSKDFYGYMFPSLTYTELYHFTNLALNDKYEYQFNMTSRNCRFPHHLLLPRGQEGDGLAVQFVFVITPYNYHFHKAYNLDCDFSSGILSFDNMPYGFPFDRKISESIFMKKNIFVKNMKIYHDENVE